MNFCCFEVDFCHAVEMLMIALSQLDRRLNTAIAVLIVAKTYNLFQFYARSAHQDFTAK